VYYARVPNRAARAFSSTEIPVHNAADLLSFEALTRDACVSTKAFPMICGPLGNSTVSVSGSLMLLALNH
jgi:hypothetical protein